MTYNFCAELTKNIAEDERYIFIGLQRYVDNMVGEYLTEQQMSILCESLRKLRYRTDDNSMFDGGCAVVYEGKCIKNRFIPRKELRKDEMAILLYNIAPYALLSRIQTARFAKCSFPNFFASVATINSTFTKHMYPEGSISAHSIPLQITNFRTHSPKEVENVLMGLVHDNEL